MKNKIIGTLFQNKIWLEFIHFEVGVKAKALTLE
jgi:hypothetical protein